jgi:hypothetical protein
MERRSSKLLVFLMLCAAATVAFFVVPSALAQSSPTRTINFSARLKASNGTAVPDGLYNVSFRLYEASEAGSPIWSETYYDENGVAAGQDYRVKVAGGYLNVQLGSRTAFGNIDWNKNLWLTMNIGGTQQIASTQTIAWDGEMSPRIQLSAVPYAMNAGSLDGKKAGDFIQLGQGVQTNNSDNPSIHINNTGTGNLVQLKRNDKDVFTIDAGGNIAFGSGSGHTISIDQSKPNTDGQTLAISGGDGGEGDTNGGNLVLSGGDGSGSGADGLVVLTTTAFATATDDANCYPSGRLAAASCVITQATVDTSSAAMVGFSTASQTATLPDPTLATPGRILYIMAANDSLPFSLIINQNEPLSLQGKTALTLLWNGSDWVVASQNGAPSQPTTTPADPVVTEETEEQPPLVIEEGTDNGAVAIEGADPANDGPTTDPETTDGLAEPLQLSQLDGAPIASPGTMYYDTTLGKVQCYEASGWGACGDAPDTFIAISPEYTNAVMNGTDIGIISSDFCSGTLGINDGSNAQPTVCAENETYNFYRWTSEEDADQTRSIYLTYQLPDNFKSFIPSATAIMGRSDSDNAKVSYQVYRDNGTGLLSCGSLVTISAGAQSAWQKGLATGDSDPASCNFEAGDSILFRINLTAKQSANAYVSNVNFIFRNS